MKQASNRLIQMFSILFAAAPFGFALVRAVRTRTDLRYLWRALASVLGTMAVITLGRAYGRRGRAAVALSASAFVSATLFAVSAALLLGTTAGLGLWVVASAFGFCCAASYLLHTLARKRGT